MIQTLHSLPIGAWRSWLHKCNNLAGLYRAQGNYTEVEPLYRRSLAIREKALEPEHLDFAASLENYAELLRETYRPNEAAEMEARAKAIRAKYE